MLALPYEIWRDIPGYEGLYQISNLGRIKSLDRYVKHWRGGLKKRKGIILALIYDKDGYTHVKLGKDGIIITKSIHRLVAETFIYNPDNLPIINHKDENPSNNCVWNLEWCTVAYNNKYGNRLNKVSKKLKNNSFTSKPVLQYTLDGQLVKQYPSIKEACRQTGIKHPNLSACCLHKPGFKTAGGYSWEFA